MYETFEHTADLGLRVQSETLRELFSEAAHGLFSMIVENPETIRPQVRQEIEIPGSEVDYLLFDWLSELLYLFECQHLLLNRFDIQLSDSGLKATVEGEPADPARHQLSHEVKAITYHQLTVEEISEGWRAELIVDI